MINRLGYTPQYQQKPAFKGKKEVKMIVQTLKDVENPAVKGSFSKKLTNAGSKFNYLLDEGLAKKKDFEDASIVEDLSKNMKRFIKGFLNPEH